MLFGTRASLGLASAVGYIAQGVNFDGSTTYLDQGGLGGDTDTKFWTVSFWVRTSITNDKYIYQNSALGEEILTTGTGTGLRFRGQNTASATILNCITGDISINDGDWHHVLFSVDMSDNAKRHVYVDDADVSPTWTAYLDFAFDHTSTDKSVGAETNGVSKFTGDIADFYMNIATYIDFSDVTNRREFIDNNKRPVNLGTDGARPTGTAPLIFLRGEVASWHTNKGSGAGFTENGTLTAASSNPP